MIPRLTAEENVELVTDISRNPMKPRDAMAAAGLNVGDRVVAYAGDLVKDGIKVRIE